MSEYINNSTKREEKLKEAIRLVHAGKDPEELKESFKDLLDGASAQEIAKIEQALIKEGLPIEQIQLLCDVHVAMFKQSLDQQLPPQMQPGHPVYTMSAENEFAELLLHGIDEKVKELGNSKDKATYNNLLPDIKKLMEFNKHYLRKENLLFPMLEKYDFTGPSSVMWGIHDDIRKMWKELNMLLSDQSSHLPQIIDLYQKLAHTMREMFYKEERILFPNSIEKLSDQDWETIYNAVDEIGLAYVTRGNDWKSQDSAVKIEKNNYEEFNTKSEEMDMVEITLSVGRLNPKQIDLMLQNLPVDVTYVDENDEVAFYSQSRERIFARTPAIIGRKVHNCHPPASVDKVVAIVKDFRAGKKDTAEFWIQMNGKFIHIRYFAIRDEDGKYRGTMEVTQDITDIKKLEGEKRLAD